MVGANIERTTSKSSAWTEIDVCDNELAAGAAEAGGDFLIQRLQPDRAVNHHDDDLGFIQRNLYLAFDLAVHLDLRVRDQSAGVDDLEPAPELLHVADDAVAGDARFLQGDGDPAADQAVEKR